MIGRCLNVSLLAVASYFDLNIGAHQNVSNQEYIELNQKLRTKEKEIVSEIERLYPRNSGYSSIDDFIGRCARGVRQVLIDPE